MVAEPILKLYKRWRSARDSNSEAGRPADGLVIRSNTVMGALHSLLTLSFSKQLVCLGTDPTYIYLSQFRIL
jgi:hypothetical protein